MRLTILFLAACGALFAQNPNPCSQITNTATAGQVLSANNGGSTPPCSWITNGGGGGGTVTNVSAGTLSPLFTTTVTNPTTTPSIAFNLSNTNNNTFLGNVSGGSAGWAAVTNTAVTAALNQFTNTLQGLVPGSGGGTTNFLRADGTWAAPSGGSGTVTSVSFTGGLISVATPTTTPALTVAGTSGGIPYFSGSATWASSGALTGIVRGGSPPTAAELSGDVNTSGSNAATVTHVNGIAYSATAAAHSVEVITTANTTATAKVIPDCTDASGNHLNYTQSTDAFSCGTTSSGGGASITSGTFANLPGTCTHTSTQSDLYFQTDGPYKFVCTATNTFTPFIDQVGQLTLPPTSSWTWDNQGSSTVDSTRGLLHLETNRGGNNQVRMYYRTAPATPYSATFFYRANVTKPSETNATQDSSGAGIGFRDGSGKIIAFYIINQWAWNVAEWSSSTSFSSNHSSFGGEVSQVGIAQHPGIWLRIRDDGTNLIFYWSLEGQFWLQFDSLSRTSFFASGPTQFGVIAFANSDGPTIDVLSVVTQ